MKLKDVMPYIVGRVSIYHEPRNEMVDEDLLLGHYDLDDHREYDSCLLTFGKFTIAEEGISSEAGFDEIRILLSR